MAFVSGSESPREGALFNSRRGACGSMKTASSAETPPTVERTQTRGKKLKHKRFAYSVVQGRALEYESSRYSGRLTASTSFKQNSKLSSALRDNEFESLKSSLVAILRSAFIPEERRASLSFSAEKVRFPRELDSAQGEYR